MGFWTGNKGGFEQRNMLSPDQMGLQNQLMGAGMGRGAGGAFGEAADYYRGLLGNDSKDFDMFAAPEMRRYREQTIPDLAEQFAGMGSGNLGSSGFQNSAVSSGTDLAERLGSIRAQLRQQGAQGLQNIGQMGLQPYMQNIYRPSQQGALPGIVGGLSQGIGTALSGLGTSWLMNMWNKK